MCRKNLGLDYANVDRHEGLLEGKNYVLADLNLQQSPPDFANGTKSFPFPGISEAN